MAKNIPQTRCFCIVTIGAVVLSSLLFASPAEARPYKAYSTTASCKVNVKGHTDPHLNIRAWWYNDGTRTQLVQLEATTTRAGVRYNWAKNIEFRVYQNGVKIQSKGPMGMGLTKVWTVERPKLIPNEWDAQAWVSAGKSGGRCNAVASA